jgi:hypothetical protein
LSPIIRHDRRHDRRCPELLRDSSRQPLWTSHRFGQCGVVWYSPRQAIRAWAVDDKSRHILTGPRTAAATSPLYAGRTPTTPINPAPLPGSVPVRTTSFSTDTYSSDIPTDVRWNDSPLKQLHFSRYSRGHTDDSSFMAHDRLKSHSQRQRPSTTQSLVLTLGSGSAQTQNNTTNRQDGQQTKHSVIPAQAGTQPSRRSRELKTGCPPSRA